MTGKRNIALRVAIAESGRSQRDIAREIGINEASLSRLVNGRSNGDEATRAALARVLDRHIHQLFDLEGASQ